MFWRFFAAADDSVDRFISRDVDSRLMQRDYVAVTEWEQSGLAFHVLRDHPSHSRYAMSGGLWGCVKGALPNLMDQIDSYPANSNYLTDMNFLNSIVWPLAESRVLQHDSFSCDVFRGAQAYPVAADPRGAHVGQVSALCSNVAVMRHLGPWVHYAPYSQRERSAISEAGY